MSEIIHLQDVLLNKFNVRSTQNMCIFASNSECFRTNIRANDTSRGKSECKGDGNTATAGTEIEDLWRGGMRIIINHPTDQLCGFGSRYEDIRIDRKTVATEVSEAQNILNWLPRQ